MTNKYAKWSAAYLPALVLLLCGAYLLYLPLRARYLLNRLEMIQVGHSNFEDAQRLAQKIGAKPDDFGPCNRSYCFWSAEVDNGGWARSDPPKMIAHPILAAD